MNCLMSLPLCSEIKAVGKGPLKLHPVTVPPAQLSHFSPIIIILFSSRTRQDAVTVVSNLITAKYSASVIGSGSTRVAY